jgi:hypothetical protein
VISNVLRVLTLFVSVSVGAEGRPAVVFLTVARAKSAAENTIAGVLLKDLFALGVDLVIEHQDGRSGSIEERARALLTARPTLGGGWYRKNTRSIYFVRPDK